MRLQSNLAGTMSTHSTISDEDARIPWYEQDLDLGRHRVITSEEAGRLYRRTSSFTADILSGRNALYDM